MARFAIALLGEFQAALNGAPVTGFESDKARALLIYLAAEPCPHRRTLLADLLWPGMPAGSARHNLSQALFTLREAIGDRTADPPFLLSNRDTIQFNPASDHSVDVAQFTALLTACDNHAHAHLARCSDCAERLQQAVDLYQGDFLAHFFLADSAVFEEWAVQQREYLRRRAQHALTHLTTYYEQTQAYRPALQLCERQLTLDPWGEEAHQQFMRLLALSGQRSSALAHFERCRRLLADELGAEPTAETKQLYEQIRNGAFDRMTRLALTGWQDDQMTSAAEHPVIGREPLGRGHSVIGQEPLRRGHPVILSSCHPVTLSPPHNLPTQLTPFLGREEELAAIRTLLSSPDCRLLTLVGVGGMGKTRLAIQAAAQQQGLFRHGSAFAPLAPVVGREQIVTAIADALGIVLYQATDRAAQLFHYLQEKNLLLILDNFEHLLADSPSVSLVGELLTNAPALKVLVTTREPLQIQAEWVYEVQGLTLPVKAELAELEASSAAQLFIQRAGQARVGFRLTTNNYPAVLRICRLVEGLPLGIELAAAWVRTLSCAEIADELQRSLDFLANTARDAPARHRSLRAVFDHSWQLLTSEEQRALSKLAIFRGGFGREAAATVADASLSLLSALVAKSLLRRTAAGRYDLHELVRQYALHQLQVDEAAYHETQQRHCHYYAMLLERWGPAFHSAERSTVVTELLTELANIRSSWHWAATHQQASELSQAADTLFWLYESRSNCREGVPLFGEAVQGLQRLVGTATSTGLSAAQRLALGQVLSYQGYFYFRQGQHPQGRELLQRSRTLLHPLVAPDDRPACLAYAMTLAFLGTVMVGMGDYDEGRRHLQESLQIKRALADHWGAAFCLRQLGLAAFYLGDGDEAYRLLQESLALARQLGDTWSIVAALTLLSRAAYAQGHYGEAQQLLAEGLPLSRALEDRASIAAVLNGLGLVNQALNHKTEAQHYFQESIALWREIGDEGNLAPTLNLLGDMCVQAGDWARAQPCFTEALAAARSASVTPVVMDALLGLATLQVQRGETTGTQEILAHICQHPASTQATRERAAQLQAALAGSSRSVSICFGQVKQKVAPLNERFYGNGSACEQ